jgi:hypothetical protein
MNNKYINTMHLFLYNEFPDILEFNFNRVEMAGRELLVRSVREVFGHDGHFTTDDVRRYVGRYALYRPYHHDPKHSVLAVELAIGHGHFESGEPLGAFDCSVTHRYPEIESDGIREEVSRGKIVKHGDTATLFMSDDHRSHFILYIDYRHGSQVFTRLGGILLARSAGSDPSSAWPFFARRLRDDEDFEPGPQQLETVPNDAFDHLGRGAIYWKYRDYPGFPPQPK